jgi:hypothetical protein
MSLRFALRPRIRLHESAEPPRRERRKLLPPVALPIAGYWLGMAALTHVLILVGKGEAAESSEVTAAAESPAERADNAFERAPSVGQTESAPVATAAPLPVPEPTGPKHEEQDRAALDSAPPTMDASATATPRQPDARPWLDSAPPRAALAAEPERPIEQDRDEPPLDLPEAPAPVPTERESLPVSSGLPSCESFAETASQGIDFDDAHARSPDLPAEAFSRVLNQGGYLSGCSIPDRTALDICVAVQASQVRGVSVQTRPHDPRVSACVARAAARLRFPHSPHLDIARTHFDALR